MPLNARLRDDGLNLSLFLKWEGAIWARMTSPLWSAGISPRILDKWCHPRACWWPQELTLSWNVSTVYYYALLFTSPCLALLPLLLVLLATSITRTCLAITRILTLSLLLSSSFYSNAPLPIIKGRLERGRLPSSAAFTFVCSFSICVVLVVVVILGLGPFYWKWVVMIVNFF